MGGFGREASTPDCQTLGIPDLDLGSRLSLLEYAPDTIAGAVLSFVTVSLTYRVRFALTYRVRVRELRFA